MAIEHVNVSDPEIHEPKDVSTASAGQVYVADGAGSGAWTDNAISSHGEMYITNNSTAIAVTAAVDATLNTDTDYVKLNGTGIWQAGQLSKVTFNVDELIAPTAGDYKIDFWAAVSGPNNGTLAFKYAVNDSTPYSTRKILYKSNATDTTMVSGFGFATGLSASDTLSMYVACDTTGNVTVKEAGFVITLLSAD